MKKGQKQKAAPKKTATAAKAKTQKTTAAKATPKAASKKKVKVKFLKSPTGSFGLAYNVGDEAEVMEAMAKDMIEANCAELVK